MNFAKIIKNIHYILFMSLSITLFVILVFNPDNLSLSSSTFIFLISTFNVALSYYFLSKGENFDFEFLFSLILYAGTFVKLAVHSAFHYKWAEPIGGFVESAESLSKVTNIISLGLLGVLIGIIINKFLYKKKKYKASYSLHVSRKTIAIVILAISIIFLIVNLEYNILTLGLMPSVKLPFKGNIIFFLSYTRYIFYIIFLFWFRSLDKSNYWLPFLVAAIASVGTLSRMIPVIVFGGLFTLLIKGLNDRSEIRSITPFVGLLLCFGLSSVLTIGISNKLRDTFYKSNNTTSSDVNEDASVVFEYVEQKNIQHKLYETGLKRHDLNAPRILTPLIHLGVDRWIGLEGVMAVEGYPGKGFQFFKNALVEPSYEGKSLFSLISHSRLKGEASRKENKISTSVPGPLAFFYYTGNQFFLMFMMVISVLACRGILELFSKLSVPSASLSYLASVLVFDFFQLGISPLSFVKNWSFSIFLFLILALLGKRNSHSM